MNCPSDPKSILVVRLSSMGDIVILTPVFRRLREKFPQSRIDFVTKSAFVSLVAGNPFISNVIAYDPHTKYAGWKALCRQIQERRYDLLIDLHNNIRSHILARQLRPIPVLRYYKPRLKRFLLFYLWLNFFPSDFNLLNEYLGVLKPLGIDAKKSASPELFLSPEAIIRARELLDRRGLSDAFITILPIATWPNKLFPLEKYTDIAKLINIKLNMPVLWLGGRRDIHLQQLDYIVPGKSVRLAGETTLEESLAILSLSRAVIGNDTGLTYAAEALGVPVALILGPTSLETGAGSHADHSITLEAKVFCRPCSQKGDRRCYRRRHQLCFDLISTSQVFDALVKILGAEP